MVARTTGKKMSEFLDGRESENTLSLTHTLTHTQRERERERERVRERDIVREEDRIGINI